MRTIGPPAAPNPALRAIAGFLSVGADIILPRRCLSCRERVLGTQGLCPQCWAQLRFLVKPGLAGEPAEGRATVPDDAHDPETGELVEIGPARLDVTRSALLYDHNSRPLILGFKHGERLEFAPVLARWMVDAGQDVLAECDMLLPVPLHRWRLLRRGFNQSAILARRIGAATGVPVPTRLLRRVKPTRSQQGLGGDERMRNITSEAFAVAASQAGRVQGARILLVDDVLTTGSTLKACAAVLRRHGARSVGALTLARAGFHADMR